MSGFTLLELMVVVVIAGILLAIGVPAMGNFIRNSRMTAAANDLMGTLHYARSEAIKRRAPVTSLHQRQPPGRRPGLRSVAAADRLGRIRGQQSEWRTG